MSEPNWVNVQKKTFTRWVNTYLSEKMMKCEDLQNDLSDGLNLLALLEVISSKQVTPKFNKTPKLKMQKVENLNFCINFLTQEGIKLVNIDGTDIADGNLKIILGLIWTIILRYQIQVSEQGSAKADLLAWVRSKIPEYDINNFTNDWTDGKAIMALAEAVQPGQFNLPQDFSDPLSNARNAIQSAKDKMSIPDILDPNDMVNSPDELSNMTYISYFRDYLDMLSRRQQEELLERTPVAANCVAFGPGLENGVVAQEETHFTIEARNVHGRKVPVGGHTFDVNIIGPNGENVEHNLIDNLDGTYQVTYATKDQGAHTIEVKHKAEHIKNSPYHITVNPSLPWAATSGIKNYSFVVQSRDRSGNDKTQGGANVEVHIQSQSGQKQKAQVMDNGDGTYNVEYSLGEKKGRYTIHVVLDGNDVGGTPFEQTVD